MHGTNDELSGDARFLRTMRDPWTWILERGGVVIMVKTITSMGMTIILALRPADSCESS